VTVSDPDSGTQATSYDGNGNALTVTQSGGSSGADKAISYAYDADNRKTAEYDTTGGAGETTTDELASWAYDTLAAGQPTSSTSYVGGTGGTSYTQAVTGYNAIGLPQGIETKISGGTWAGTYKELYAYSTYANQVTDVTLGGVGGLPLEDVPTGYDAADQPASVGSSLWSYASASYNELGQPLEYALGTSTEPAWIRNTYDQATNRFKASGVQTGVSPVTIDDTNYSYDHAGLITAEADTPASGPAQVQCFTYDYLGRLGEAWSQGSMPSAGCPSSGPATQASEAAAAAPYYDQYSYDVSGDLTSVTSTEMGHRPLLRPVLPAQAQPVGLRRPGNRGLPPPVRLDEDRPARAGPGQVHTL
jgi:hypothetical protein